VPISIPQHRRLIERHGEWVDHYRGQLCPCADDRDPSRSDPTCKVCHGQGIFWRDQGTLQGIITGMHADRSGRFWLQNGVALPEDMLFSQDPLARRQAADFDLIVPRWTKGFPFQGELLVRGQDDRLFYRATNGVLGTVLEVDAASGAIVEYAPGTDYTVDPDWQTLHWVPGRGPVEGTQYSVKYHARYEFVCFNPPAQRFERGVDIGQRALLRKRHLPMPTVTW
jgi:hypothetical protein